MRPERPSGVPSRRVGPVRHAVVLMVVPVVPLTVALVPSVVPLLLAVAAGLG